MVDPGVDGRGAQEGSLGGLAPKSGGLGQSPQRGCRGRAPAGGLRGKAPQKLKPKNGLDASQKAFGDVEC